MNYQAQVAQNNAAIAGQNEALTIQSGEVAVNNQQMKMRSAVANTKAGQAASGVDVNSGSFVSARAGEAELGMMDALNIRTGYARQAYSDAVTAMSDTAQAQLDTAEGAQAKTAGDIGAAGSLISGVSSAAGNWQRYQMNSGVNSVIP
jgi:hypothetical protein